MFCSEWEALGCYKDYVEDREILYSREVDPPEDPENMSEGCGIEAEKRGFDFFAVQSNWGQCWGGVDDYKTYDKQGCANNCKTQGEYGTGTFYSNFVYHLKSGKKLHV